MSALLHLVLLVLLATFTFGAGSGLVGLGAEGLGEAEISLGRDPHSELDARELLEKISIDPMNLPQPRPADAQLPQLESLGMPVIDTSRLRQISSRFSAPVGNFTGEFGSLIGRLRKSGLDVVLVVDATGSMQQVIDELTRKMGNLVGTVQRLVPTARFAAVAFRDWGDEYVARSTDLTFHGDKVKKFLSQLRAAGGGDWEEAVKEALDKAIHELSWRRRSGKVIILVGSSPPHADEMPELIDMVSDFRAGGGIVNTIDITRRLHEEFQRWLRRSLPDLRTKPIPPLPEFYRVVSKDYGKIAAAGGGEMAGIGWKEALTEQILVFTFGSRWRDQVIAASGAANYPPGARRPRRAPLSTGD